MQKAILLIISILLLLSSCTWVEPTVKGSEIKLVEQNGETLKTCEKLGSVTSMVKHEIGFFNRSEEKVNTELATIAQNEAAEMGGDTIAAEGPTENGHRTFTVYKCIE
ncbi:MAG: DUF4156 domain-containing protein [Desulfocapsaceae bacterium]